MFSPLFSKANDINILCSNAAAEQTEFLSGTLMKKGLEKAG